MRKEIESPTPRTDTAEFTLEHPDLGEVKVVLSSMPRQLERELAEAKELHRLCLNEYRGAKETLRKEREEFRAHMAELRRELEEFKRVEPKKREEMKWAFDIITQVHEVLGHGDLGPNEAVNFGEIVETVRQIIKDLELANKIITGLESDRDQLRRELEEAKAESGGYQETASRAQRIRGDVERDRDQWKERAEKAEAKLPGL